MADTKEQAKARKLADLALKGLLDIRHNTPVDWADTPEGRSEVWERLWEQDALLDQARSLVFGQYDFIEEVLFPVKYLFDWVKRDGEEARLPRPSEDPTGVPGKDPTLLMQQSMREEAAEAAAEPATNGYDQSSAGKVRPDDTPATTSPN